MNKKTSTKKEPSQTNIKICYRCNREIFGEFEYIKTKRRTEIYLCKECAVAMRINT